MVNLHVAYEGELRCTATHGPSGTHITTDAPVDNYGRGETFSPTDLVGAALGSCMVTVMGIAARARQFDLTGTQVSVVKEMTQQRPRRIARLTANVRFPQSVTQVVPDAMRHELQTIAENCPVRLSLLAAIDVPMVFTWE